MSDSPYQILTLCRGWLDLGRYVWSPFVIKLEHSSLWLSGDLSHWRARLRFANVPSKTAPGSVKTRTQERSPCIEIADETSSDSIGDSTLINKHLIERNILPDLNSTLSPSEKAHDLAIRALHEDKAYFYNEPPQLQLQGGTHNLMVKLTYTERTLTNRQPRTREQSTENYYAMRGHFRPQRNPPTQSACPSAC
ncbi:uncharacterized protein BJX67DRAFT_384410 [Aspergillus lucknowensis]|uniref:Thioredoxin-like fold domain-containing protein n=1 Tax=Aspergillus lucknowensis TaxID=176173 RepID=A0ABR4LGS9_9EURO